MSPRPDASRARAFSPAWRALGLLLCGLSAVVVCGLGVIAWRFLRGVAALLAGGGA